MNEWTNELQLFTGELIYFIDWFSSLYNWEGRGDQQNYSTEV